jgi:hypothetical protein
MEFQNPASRLHAILRTAAGHAKKQSGALHWAWVFGIPTGDVHTINYEVAQRLVWIGSELDVLVAYLRDVRNYPERGYVDIRNGILNATSPQLIGHQADNIRGFLTPQLLAALEQISFNLPEEEATIDAEQLEVFIGLLEKLTEAVESAPVGSLLNGLLNRHIRLLRRALDAYPIWGVRAFSDSLRDAAGDLYVIADSAAPKGESDGDRSLRHQVTTIWAAVYRVVESAEKMRKTLMWIGYGAQGATWLRDHSS